MADTQSIKKELLSASLDQQNPEGEFSAPENQNLTEDLTPTDKLDLAAQTRLENSLQAQRQQQEATDLNYWRAKIAKFQELQHSPAAARAIHEAFSGRTQIDIQELKATANAHTGTFYGETLRKKLKETLSQQQNQDSQHSGSSNLNEAGKILRFGSSSGEDDTNQKAA